MAKIDYIMDHFPNIYDKNKNTMTYKLMSAFGDKLDEFLVTLEDVKNSHYINYTKGSDLDKLGAIINVTRFLNEDDEAYRSRIKTKIPSFIGGGTKESIKQVVETYLGVTPTIVEHYNPDEGHPYFDNGVFSGYDYSSNNLILSVKGGISYIDGNKITSVDTDLNLPSNTTSYILMNNDGTIISNTSQADYTQIPLYTIVTSTAIDTITDNRKILDPYKDNITNTASITVQIPYDFNEGLITVDDTKSILRNTVAAGIALLIDIIGTYDESITITDSLQAYFIVGFSRMGSSNYIGG